MEEVFRADKSTLIQPWEYGNIQQAINSFETVFTNDMPEMSTFAGAQIGIYRTEDLVKHSSLQIDGSVRPMLLPLALADIHEAGRCLAFRVPTAAAFHTSRAIETGMNQYYEAISGKPFELKDAARKLETGKQSQMNWQQLEQTRDSPSFSFTFARHTGTPLLIQTSSSNQQKRSIFSRGRSVSYP
jgi:hypothetical protein